MLFVLIGTDARAKTAARHKIWKGVLSEIDAASVSLAEFASLAATDSLFGEPRAYRLQNVFALPEESGLNGDSIVGMAKDIAASPHMFILEEEKLLVGPKRALEKAGAKIVETAAATKKEPFNVFALGGALGKRDRKQLWLLLMSAFEGGVAPENIAGILAWKARTMCASAHSAPEKKEWAAISRKLVVMYHDSHRGAGDLALLLERFALTL